MKSTSILKPQIHIPLMLGIIISLCTITLKGQSVPDFSGKWEFDKTKSNPGQVASDYDGRVVRKILQTPSTISYSEIYIKTGNDDWETAVEEFNLDGKESSEAFSRGIIKKSAKWSEDKKSITLTYIDSRVSNGVAEDFLRAESLKLSDEGQTLSIETFSKNPVKGEKTVLSIYHKYQ